MNDKTHWRMCIGCRKIMHKDMLVRICKVNSELYIDRTKKMGGRGAYLCSMACLKNAEKGKRLSRNLKTAMTDAILSALQEEFANGTGE